MTPLDPRDILDRLLKLPDETEWVEFKEAKNSFDAEKLGHYFSALSNEANLKGKEYGWLVFGVQDKPREVVGTQFKTNRPDLDSLKLDIANQTTSRLTFIEIYEVAHSKGRVVMFQIPAALRGVPTAWKGHWYGRDGESLVALNLGELEQIRKQSNLEDWSARIVEGATLADLDSAAIKRAREEFKKKNAGLAAEVDDWDDTTFLNKAKVCIAGKITRTAIILLGKPESEVMLSPAISQITWVLKDERGVEIDYAHFHPPLLVNTEAVFGKIRNLTYRYIKKTALFPDEVSRYDPWVIREPAQLYCPSGLLSLWPNQRGRAGRPPALHECRLIYPQVGRGRDLAGFAAGYLPQPLPRNGDGRAEHDRHDRKRHQRMFQKQKSGCFQCPTMTSPNLCE